MDRHAELHSAPDGQRHSSSLSSSLLPSRASGQLLDGREGVRDIYSTTQFWHPATDGTCPNTPKRTITRPSPAEYAMLPWSKRPTYHPTTIPPYHQCHPHVPVSPTNTTEGALQPSLSTTHQRVLRKAQAICPAHPCDLTRVHTLPSSSADSSNFFDINAPQHVAQAGKQANRQTGKQANRQAKEALGSIVREQKGAEHLSRLRPSTEET